MEALGLKKSQPKNRIWPDLYFVFVARIGARVSVSLAAQGWSHSHDGVGRNHRQAFVFVSFFVQERGYIVTESNTLILSHVIVVSFSLMLSTHSYVFSAFLFFETRLMLSSSFAESS